MMDSTSPSLLSPLGTQRSNSPSSGSLQTQDFGGGGYAASELNAGQLSPSPSSMATTTSHDAHDTPSSAGSRKKNFKTEYKSKFTPFDQYAYNEVTDSFVKQTTTNLESHPPSSICTSKSNQDLAYHQQESSHSHLGAQQIPTINTHEASLCEPSVNGEDHQQAPWYKEVVKRNEKANEYRFKSEVGHNSPLLGYTTNRSDSPYLNSELSRQINSPFGDALSTAGSEQVAGSVGDTRSQQGEYPADPEAKQKYRFTPSDYKRTDHMIAHMANNNNFALPKDQTDHQSAAPRRAQVSSAGAKGAVKSAAQVRARSQSTRRQPTSTTSSTNARAQPTAKSNQTTPTKTAISRPPTARAPLASTRPSTRVTSTTRTNAVADNNKPTSTAASRTGVTSSRVTSASTNRRPVASSNPTGRLATASSKPTSNGTNQTNRPASSSIASKKPAVPSARTAPAPRTLTSAKPATKPTTNSSAIAAGRLPPTNTKAPSSSRTTAAASAKNKVATNKAPPPPSSTNTVKSIKTSKAIAAEEAASAAVSKKLNDQPNKAASEHLENKQQSDRSQYNNNEPNLVQLQQHRFYDNNEPNLIFTTTPAGNMLADELAQAEKAALDAKKVEIPPAVESRDTQKEFEMHDDSSSPDSAVDKLGADQSAGSRHDSGERDEIKETPQPDHDAPLGGETDNDHNESGLDDTLYVTAISGGDTTRDSSGLIETGGTLVDDAQSNVPASRRFSLEAELAKLADSHNGKSEHGDDLIVEESECLVDTSPALESANTTINGPSKTEEPAAQKDSSEALPQSNSCDSITEALTARVQSTPDKNVLEGPAGEQPPVEEDIKEQEPVESKEILLSPEDLVLSASSLEDPKAAPHSFFTVADNSTTGEQDVRKPPASSSSSSSSSSSDEDELEKQSEKQDSQQQAAPETGMEPKSVDPKEILLIPEDLMMPTGEPVAQAPKSEDSTSRQRSASESSSSSSSSPSLPSNKNEHEEHPEEPIGQQPPLMEEAKTESELVDPENVSESERPEAPASASETPKLQPYSFVSVPETSEEPSKNREPESLSSSSSSSSSSSDEEKPEKPVGEEESQKQIIEEVKTEPMLVDFNKIFEADDLVMPTSAAEPLKAQPDSFFPVPETSSTREPSQLDGDEPEKRVEKRDSQPSLVDETKIEPMLVDFNKTFEEDDLVMPSSAPDTPKAQPYSFFAIPENSTAMAPSGPDGAEKQSADQRLVEDIQIVDKASDTKPMHQESSGMGESLVQTSTAETPRTQPDSFDMFLMDGPNSSRAHLESEDKLF